MTEYALKDIQPNPFRHLERYPIDRKKVDALKESIKTTGFWDNIVARPGKNGPELAYGHHRLVALKEQLGASHKVKLIIKDLSDEAMLKIMARENMEEWSGSIQIEHETVRAVVLAFAGGIITLPPPKNTRTGRSTGIRLAPSFLEADPYSRWCRMGVTITEEKAYTASTISEFLGWLKQNGGASGKVVDALGALELIERKVLSENDYAGLNSHEAAVVTAEAHKARARTSKAAPILAKIQHNIQSAKETKSEETKNRLEKQIEEQIGLLREEDRRADAAASKAGHAVSQALQKGEIGSRQARDLIIQQEGVKAGRKSVPEINDYAKTLASEITAFLDPSKERGRRLAQIIQHREALRPIVFEGLTDALNTIAQHAEKFLSEFKRPLVSRQAAKALPGGKS